MICFGFGFIVEMLEHFIGILITIPKYGLCIAMLTIKMPRFLLR